MAKIGGSNFVNCSVPFAIKGRYFIVSQNIPPLFSVVREYNGKPLFEIINNQPVDNPYTNSEINSSGIITVSDKKSGKFLYKFRPDSETSIVFGSIEDGEITAKISDKKISVGGMTIEKSTIQAPVGIIVTDEGIGVGAQLPQGLIKLFANN